MLHWVEFHYFKIKEIFYSFRSFYNAEMLTYPEKSETWVLKTDSINCMLQFGCQCFPGPGLRFH